MRTINKSHLSVVKFASTDETRFTMNGVLIEEVSKKDGTNGVKATATDGRTLAEYESFNDQAKEMPVIPGMDSAQNTATSAIVPSEAIKQVKKSLPKNQKTLPVLHNALVKMGESVTTFGSTDLETASVVPAKNIEGHFPRVDQIWPTRTPLFKIAINPEYLKRIADVVKEVTDAWSPSVTLSFYGQMEPMRFDLKDKDGHLRGLVMPMKANDVGPFAPASYAHEMASLLEITQKSVKDKALLEKIKIVLDKYASAEREMKAAS